MKILIIRTHPTTINIKTYNVQELGLAKALIAQGHECDVLLYTDKESHLETISVDHNHQIKIYWMHGKNVFWQGIYQWHKLLEFASGYDYVQVNEYDQIASYYITQKLPGKSYIYHGPYYNLQNKKYNVLNRAFDLLFLKKMRKNNPIIFAKSKMAEESLRNKGFSNVFTVGVGLDIQRFGVQTDDLRRQTEKQYQLLYIGEISARRNTLFLMDVFHSVCEKMGGNVRLQIIGKGDIDYINQVKHRAKELNIEDKLQFCDKKEQTELPQVYQEADLFVFPTHYDIFGMVLLESLFFGTPVVSSPNGGAETLMKEIQCGIIVDRFDVERWASAIAELLKNRQLREKMAENGHQEIIKYFTWKAIASKMLRHLEG